MINMVTLQEQVLFSHPQPLKLLQHIGSSKLRRPCGTHSCILQVEQQIDSSGKAGRLPSLLPNFSRLRQFPNGRNYPEICHCYQKCPKGLSFCWPVYGTKRVCVCLFLLNINENGLLICKETPKMPALMY